MEPMQNYIMKHGTSKPSLHIMNIFKHRHAQSVPEN